MVGGMVVGSGSVGTAVGGTRVVVGRAGTAVRVRVGLAVFVNVARTARVRAVKVMNTCGVAVGVRVRVGVGVGVSLGPGVFEAVAVGAVAVGKGPSRACEVSASAVRVLLAPWCRSAASGDSREVRV